MKKKIVCISLAVSLVFYPIYAKTENFQRQTICEISQLLPDSLNVKGPAEGFAVHGNYAFSFHAGGQVVILDIKNSRFVNMIQLDCRKAHCNSANFGKTRYSKESKFPLCYVSECGGSNACYVIDISENGSNIVQTVKYTGKDAGRFFDWCVDAKGKYIYTYGGMHNKPKTLRKYSLPDLSAGSNVELTEKDLIQEYTVNCVKFAQGNKISGNTAYFSDAAGKLARVHKVNLRTGEETSYDISGEAFEPEDLDKKGGWFYIQDFTGKSAREAIIFKIKLK